jgi:hypothetical protein
LGSSSTPVGVGATGTGRGMTVVTGTTTATGTGADPPGLWPRRFPAGPPPRPYALYLQVRPPTLIRSGHARCTSGRGPDSSFAVLMELPKCGTGPRHRSADSSTGLACAPLAPDRNVRVAHRKPWPGRTGAAIYRSAAVGPGKSLSRRDFALWSDPLQRRDLGSLSAVSHCADTSGSPHGATRC